MLAMPESLKAHRLTQGQQNHRGSILIDSEDPQILWRPTDSLKIHRLRELRAYRLAESLQTH